MDTEGMFETRLLNQKDLLARLQILQENIIHYAKRLYVIFWHELSLDERVRKSPFVPPPKNEIKMTLSATVFFRYVRILVLIKHIMSIVALYYCITGQVKLLTIIMGLVLIVLASIGVVCGAHRLWSHNSYKATWPLRLFLVFCQTLASQYSVYSWVRDHRLHHKFSDTSVDPHNANRGLFFSHIGWIFVGRSQEAKRELQRIWMEDVEKDKIVMFQYRLYIPLVFLISFILPAFVPWYFWNENFFLSHITIVHLRVALTLHLTFTVNSVAHAYGMKPFDKFVRAVDNRFVWFTTFGGEAWHNYHHAFPWDYKSSEFWGYRTGLGTIFIEFCARHGLAYDLKTTSPEVAIKRRQRTGDISCNVFGWNDANVNPIERNLTQVHFKEPVKEK